MLHCTRFFAGIKGQILQSTSIFLLFLVYCIQHKTRRAAGRTEPLENELFDGALVQSSRVIYTPSPFARANLIHLQEAGRLQARSPH